MAGQERVDLVVPPRPAAPKQSWVEVQQQDMHDYIQKANAQGWWVLAVVPLNYSNLLGVLVGPLPSNNPS